MSRESARAWDLAAYFNIRRWRDAMLRPLTRLLGDRGVPPWAVSLTGVALAGVACWTLGSAPRAALAAFSGALLCDALDGAGAPHRRRASARGKMVDHACDTATFLLVLLAIARCDLSSLPALALAAALPVPLLIAAVLARRGRERSAETALSGGFLAHLFKVPAYAAFLLYCATGADLLDPAVKTAAITALASLALVLLSGLRRPADAFGRRPAVSDPSA